MLRIRTGSFHQGRGPGTGNGSTGGPACNGGPEQLDQAYKVLETTPGASKAEIVKAYRRQLSRHHPDKLKANGLPESMIEHAKQRTQLIIEAYELICERRRVVGPAADRAPAVSLNTRAPPTPRSPPAPL